MHSVNRKPDNNFMTDKNPFPIIVDAHLDMAYNVLNKHRDYRRAAHATRELGRGTAVEKQSGACTVGLPDLIRGRVGLVFATIFTEPARHKISDDLPVYHNAEEAHTLGMQQLDFYRRWADEDDHVMLVTNQQELATVTSGWGLGISPAPEKPEAVESHKVGLVMLMEGADPILEPKELERWVEMGLRIVGPAWDTTRYCGGTWQGGRLPKLGHELLGAAHQVHAQPHVVGEVQSAHASAFVAQAVDQIGQLDPAHRRVADLVDRLGAAGHGVDPRDDLPIVGAQLGGADRLLGEVGVQRDHRTGQGGWRMPRGPQPVSPAHHAIGQLRYGNAGQQPRSRLHPQAQALLVDEASRE